MRILKFEIAGLSRFKSLQPNQINLTNPVSECLESVNLQKLKFISSRPSKGGKND